MSPSAEAALAGRTSVVRDLRRKPWCDLLVTGGNLTAAAFAHLAAYNGLRTILVCPGDFFDERFGDFPWPLPERNFSLFSRFGRNKTLRDLAEVAPHLLYGRRFPRRFRQAWFGPTPRFTPALRPFRYHIEQLLGAKNEGAVCLNYTEMRGILRGLAGKLSAGILIKEGDVSEALEIRPSVIVDFNVADGAKGKADTLRYAMLFEGYHEASFTEVSVPPFVSVHLEPALRGTLVICDSTDPFLSSEALVQALSRVKGLEELCSAACLQFDSLPLVKEPLHSYWGESVLRVRGGDLFELNRDVTTLLEKVAAEGSQKIDVVSLRGRTLPGGAMYHEQRTAFESLAKGKLPELLIRDILMRLGGRVRHFLENPESLESVSYYSIQGEMALIRAEEEVVNDEDLLVRRLGARWL